MLIVDVGNTKTSFGFVKQNSIIKTWKISSHKGRFKDEYHAILNELLFDIDESFTNISHIVVSSVVPAITSELLKFGPKVKLITHQTPRSFEVKLTDPHSIGPDRLSSTQAMVQDYSSPSICIDLGTASTITYVDEKRNFCGGLIVPGLGISMQALFERASLLKPIVLEKPKKIVGQNTNEALLSGLVYGHAIMIKGIVDQIKEEQKLNQVDVVVTGGNLDIIHPMLPKEYKHDATLTLRGTHYLANLMELN